MRYVLHYYKEGKLDTQRALDKIQTRTGIRPQTAGAPVPALDSHRRLCTQWPQASALICI